MDESSLINFLIGSCISSDSNFTNDDRKNNIQNLQTIKIKFSNKLTENQLTAIEQGIELLQKEIESSKS